MDNSSSPVRFLLAWDFSSRPVSTFYSVLDELIAGNGAHYVQKSVYIVRDAEMAQELVALCKYYGADEIKAVPIGEGHLDDYADRKKAEQHIEALHVERLHRRGRKKQKGFTRK